MKVFRRDQKHHCLIYFNKNTSIDQIQKKSSANPRELGDETSTVSPVSSVQPNAVLVSSHRQKWDASRSLDLVLPHEFFVSEQIAKFILEPVNQP